MEYFKIDPQKPDKKTIYRAVEVLKRGGIIVYPTDTLYGLGVDMLNDKAMQKLYHIKQRKTSLPVSMVVYSIEQIEKLYAFLDKKQVEDMKKLLPGKFTVLVNSRIPDLGYISASQSKLQNEAQKVGIRIPDNRVCIELSRRLGSPVSSTSANISGKKNPYNIPDVVAQFGNKIDLILDAGPMKSDKGSTVIDLTKSPYLIKREGDMVMEEVSKLLPDTPLKKWRPRFVITFVCSGNICRSPMAAGIMNEFIKRTKYKDIIEINSAGTLKLDTEPAHDLSIQAGLENQIDLTGHRSQPVSSEIVDQADLIACMAVNHHQYLRNNFPQAKDKIILLKQWKRKKALSTPSIADPIGHNVDFFRKTHIEIHEEVKRIIPYVYAEVKKFVLYNDIVV